MTTNEVVQDGTLLMVRDGCLVCPFCDDHAGLHLDQVSAGYHQDYDHGNSRCLTATFDGRIGKVKHGPDTDLNYSSRRHWLEVHFDCELCDGGTIVFAQRKGSTEVFVIPRETRIARDVVASIDDPYES